MYERIKNRRPVRKLYTEALVNRGDLSIEDAERSLEEFSKRLQQAFDDTHDEEDSQVAKVELERPAPMAADPAVDTTVDRETLDQLVAKLTSVPDGFNVHPKLVKWLEQRAGALERNSVDWALGEALALGSLVQEGRMIRLSGQDTRRGTFSQRHSVLVDQRTGEQYSPLANLGEGQGKFFVYDSLLSEFAAMGFEYGYSVARPEALVLWEAQFGDFGNGAQTIVDEFISSGEQKWLQRSSVVLLLPHGYEGQGPDHSSARIERFLQLCAEDNMTVAQPSTPASYFHLLRRQAYQRPRRPLIVFTPKAMLRLRGATSEVDDFTHGRFEPVLDSGI